MEGGESVDGDEFEAFTREVAACIIQHYWRQCATARRQAAECRVGERRCSPEEGGNAVPTVVPTVTVGANSAAKDEKPPPRKHNTLSASLKGEDIVRLGSMVTTGGMSDLVVVVEQQQASASAVLCVTTCSTAYPRVVLPGTLPILHVFSACPFFFQLLNSSFLRRLYFVGRTPCSCAHGCLAVVWLSSLHTHFAFHISLTLSLSCFVFCFVDSFLFFSFNVCLLLSMHSPFIPHL
jgi:hypothetical protein